jgi:hypothetical protein
MVTVDDDGVGALIEQIEDQSFANDKLRVLAEAASSNWFRVSHIERILPLFAFSNDKLKALEIISPRLVDRQNKFRIYNLFTFPNDKERAQKILAKY